MSWADRATALCILGCLVLAMLTPEFWRAVRRRRFGRELTNLDRLGQELEERQR